MVWVHKCHNMIPAWCTLILSIIEDVGTYTIACKAVKLMDCSIRFLLPFAGIQVNKRTYCESYPYIGLMVQKNHCYSGV